MTPATPSSDPALRLQKAKRSALAVLLGVPGGLYATSVVLAAHPLPSGLCRAMAEAALVGGLADWFAVVALFRRPLNLPIRHTAVIPSNQARIADNLGRFIHEKFLDAQALAGLMQRTDPVTQLAAWFSVPANSQRIGRHAVTLVRHGLALVDDKRIQAFVADAVQAFIAKVDLSQALGEVLQMLTCDGRHQQLLTDVLGAALEYLKQDTVREAIVARLLTWMKTEHPMLDKLGLSDALSGWSADKLRKVLAELLQEMSERPDHDYRQAFDRMAERLVQRLQHDDELRQRADALKRHVLADPHLLDFTRSVWHDIRQWISDDLDRPPEQSAMAAQVQRMGQWMGRKLSEDEALRRSLAEHVVKLSTDLAPAFADHLVRHISNTVRTWDPQDMARQVELHIGPDLQSIRISGTLVGGLIGGLLFALARGVEWVGG